MCEKINRLLYSQCWETRNKEASNRERSRWVGVKVTDDTRNFSVRDDRKDRWIDRLQE